MDIIGCGCFRKTHREDCFYYHEEKDMGATIPCCTRHEGLGNCPCENCSKYLSKSEAYRIVEQHLKKGGLKRE